MELRTCRKETDSNEQLFQNVDFCFTFFLSVVAELALGFNGSFVNPGTSLAGRLCGGGSLWHQSQVC